VSVPKTVNIFGKIQNLDYVAEKYLSDINIRLISAVDTLKNVKNLQIFTDQNPYSDLLKKVEKLFDLGKEPNSAQNIDKLRAKEILESVLEEAFKASKEKSKLLDDKSKLTDLKNNIEPFLKLKFDFKYLKSFKYIAIRFGRMPLDLSAIEKVLTPSTDEDFDLILKSILPYLEKDFLPKNNRLSTESALETLKEISDEVLTIRKKKAEFMRLLLEAEAHKNVNAFLNDCKPYMGNRTYKFGIIPKDIDLKEVRLLCKDDYKSSIFTSKEPAFVVIETHHGMAFGVLFSDDKGEKPKIPDFFDIKFKDNSSNEELDQDILEAKLNIKASEAELLKLITKNMKRIKPAVQKLKALKPKDKPLTDELFYMVDNSKIYELSGENRGIEAIFIPTLIDRLHIWGVYFTPLSLKNRVDALFAPLHFERFYLPENLEGTPSQIYDSLNEKIDLIEKSINDIDSKLNNYLKTTEKDIKNAYYSIKKTKLLFNIRKYAANANGTFYVVGIMSNSDALTLQKDMEQDTRATCIIKDVESTDEVKAFMKFGGNLFAS